MKNMICMVLVAFVSLFAVSNVQADEHCASGTCRRPVSKAVVAVVSPAVEVTKNVVAAPVKVAKHVRRGFRRFACR